MSGLRACDEELLELGLTLPGFIERSRAVASLPSLGLLTLAGMTPSRFEPAYREVRDIQDLGSELESFDLVAISTYTAQVEEAYELADRYRGRNVPVIMGGLHVSVLPDEAMSHCDSVIVGEGELSWRQVLLDAEKGKLRQIYRANGQVLDLAAAPMPAYHLLDPAGYNRLTVQTSRGCPWRCEFCAGSILLGRRYRQKSAERVLAEIDCLRSVWPHPYIELADDNSFVDKHYWKGLLPQLSKRRLRWFAETDISVGEDDELLELLRDAGCEEVLIGLESPVAEDLRGIELESDWKRRRLPAYKKSVQNIQSHGIAVNGCFILGLDGQGPEIFDRIFEYTEELELFDVQITLQTPFPGTPLYDRLHRQGRLLADCPWRRCTLFDVTYRPTHMSPEELAEGFRQLGVRLYSESFTRWRRGLFRRKYLRAAKARRRMEA